MSKLNEAITMLEIGIFEIGVVTQNGRPLPREEILVKGYELLIEFKDEWERTNEHQ